MYAFLTLNQRVVLRKTVGHDEYGLPLTHEELEVDVYLRETNSLKSYQNYGNLGVMTYEISFPPHIEVSVMDKVVINGEAFHFKTLQRFRDLSGNLIYTKVTV